MSNNEKKDNNNFSNFYIFHEFKLDTDNLKDIIYKYLPRNRISYLRKQKGLTLQQVADAVGVGNNTISRYETGKRAPNEEMWQKLANFFKVSVPYLQGKTFSEVDILKLLNDMYFDEWRNDFDTIVTPVRTYSKIKEIDYPEITLKQSKSGGKIDFSQKIAEYWAKNYGFIFAYSNVRLLKDLPKNNKYFLDNAKKQIVDAIHSECLNLSDTVISKIFDESCYQELDNFYKDKDALMRLGTKKDIKDSIDSLITSLKRFKKDMHKLPENSNKHNLDWEDLSI